VVLGTLLKFCVEVLGVELVKVHKVLEFHQSHWMTNHISKLTDLKAQATTVTKRNFLKLSCNIIYGKLCQSPFKQRVMKLVTNARQLNNLTACMHFKGMKRISNDVCLVEMKKKTVKINRPIIAAFQVLELSKYLMYQTLYVDFEQAYTRQHLRLLMTDTDSYVLEITSNTEANPFNLLLPLKHCLETSSFPADHILYRNLTHGQKLGLLQIETGATQVITEFFGCRSKNYYLQLYNPESKEINDVKRVKGMTRASQKQLTKDHFRRCIFDRTIHRADQVNIRSYSTQLYTVKTTKSVLSSVDLKRFVLSNGIETLPYGHYRIQEEGLDHEEC